MRWPGDRRWADGPAAASSAACERERHQRGKPRSSDLGGSRSCERAPTSRQRAGAGPPRDFSAKVLEVWMVPPGGTPRSLGLFPSERSGTATSFVLSHDIAEILASGALAVSLEPSGGSKTGRPSGPVLFSGPVMAVNL